MDTIVFDTKHQHVTDFINTINEVMKDVKGIMLDKFEQEFEATGVTINIYKFAVSPYDVLTCAQEHLAGDHAETIKHVQYNESHEPISVYTYPFSKQKLENIVSDIVEFFYH